MSCYIELDNYERDSLGSKIMNTLHSQEPAIHDYFSKLNEGNFEAVSNLFSIEGCLYPPFEKEICGRVAIAQYLKSGAKDIQALPQKCTVQSICNENTQYQVTGYVKTSFFTVNVGWSIQLNATKKIVSVHVKLLAELPDLLALKRA
jgi:hypothetical protein